MALGGPGIEKPRSGRALVARRADGTPRPSKWQRVSSMASEGVDTWVLDTSLCKEVGFGPESAVSHLARSTADPADYLRLRLQRIWFSNTTQRASPTLNSPCTFLPSSAAAT